MTVCRDCFEVRLSHGGLSYVGLSYSGLSYSGKFRRVRFMPKCGFSHGKGWEAEQRSAAEG